MILTQLQEARQIANPKFFLSMGGIHDAELEPVGKFDGLELVDKITELVISTFYDPEDPDYLDDAAQLEHEKKWMLRDLQTQQQGHWKNTNGEPVWDYGEDELILMVMRSRYPTKEDAS